MVGHCFHSLVRSRRKLSIAISQYLLLDVFTVTIKCITWRRFYNTFLSAFAEGCKLFLFKYSHDSKGIFHKSISHLFFAASSPTLCTFILTPAPPILYAVIYI